MKKRTSAGQNNHEKGENERPLSSSQHAPLHSSAISIFYQNVAKTFDNFFKIIIQQIQQIVFWQNSSKFLKKCDFRAVQRSVMCRSRRELSNAYLLAKSGFDTAENEPCKVCPPSVYRSPRFGLASPNRGERPAGRAQLLAKKGGTSGRMERLTELVPIPEKCSVKASGGYVKAP